MESGLVSSQPRLQCLDQKAGSVRFFKGVVRRSVSPITWLGSTGEPNNREATEANFLLLLIQGATTGQRSLKCPRTEVCQLEAGFFTRRSKHCHVCTLSASVRVQLVQHKGTQAPWPLRPAFPLERAGQDQFHHHVVGQQDVPVARLLWLQRASVALPGRYIGAKTDGRFAFRVAVAEEFGEFHYADYSPSCVHRVDDDSLDAFFSGGRA